MSLFGKAGQSRDRGRYFPEENLSKWNVLSEINGISQLAREQFYCPAISAAPHIRIEEDCRPIDHYLLRLNQIFQALSRRLTLRKASVLRRPLRLCLALIRR